MRAQRFGATSMEADAPVSSQAFISDLKNLAEGLKQFETPKNEMRSGIRSDTRETATAAMTTATTKDAGRESRRVAALAHAQQLANQMAQAAFMSLANEPQTPIYGAMMPTAPVTPVTPITPTTSSSSSIVGLNERATQMIHEVKLGLNLSSESEAINLMVSLAYRHLKDLLV